MASLRDKSIFLSLLLRHKPEAVGLKLQPGGWLSVDTLLWAVDGHKKGFSNEDLEQIVAEDNKQRYSYSDDRKMIRANQGHSIDVDLGFEPIVPPCTLYHGTAKSSLESIREQGITSQSRLHVHLTDDHDTAVTVGARHGDPVVLHVDANSMHELGYVFYRSVNGVWLTGTVPPQYFQEV
ncbi:MAG: RNA 2'-phosphotransferase [Neptunomonas phycophila]|uniref:RNA 2'-phosphotransferase n=1 Tax=Neptunomonas phycophila TaxID=1572645 RepID=UPI003B8CA5CC